MSHHPMFSAGGEFYTRTRRRMTWQQLFYDYERFVMTPAGPERMPLLNGVFRATAEFLSKTEHKRKFHHAEFVKVLHESAKSAKAFSAHDAEESFRAMERIARNLYLQPWRIDQFRSIKKWNHLYKCRIAPCLIEADRIFKLIGYEEKGDELVLSGEALSGRPSKKVLEVAFDCFVASLECRLMGTVRSLVENGDQLPWARILKARETVVGDVQRCAAKIDPKAVDCSPNVLFAVDGSERKESLLLPELQAPPSWDELSSLHFHSMEDPWSVVPSATSSAWSADNARIGSSVQAGTLISVPVQGGLRRTNFPPTDAAAAGPPPIPAHQPPMQSSSPYNSMRNRSPPPGLERHVPVQRDYSPAHASSEYHERQYPSSHNRGTLPSGLSNERVVPMQVDPSYYTKRHSSSLYHPQQSTLAAAEAAISDLNDRINKMTTDVRSARQKAQTVARSDGNVECPHCQMFISPATIICPHCGRLVGDFIYS